MSNKPEWVRCGFSKELSRYLQRCSISWPANYIMPGPAMDYTGSTYLWSCRLWYIPSFWRPELWSAGYCRHSPATTKRNTINYCATTLHMYHWQGQLFTKRSTLEITKRKILSENLDHHKWVLCKHGFSREFSTVSAVNLYTRGHH